MQPRAYIPKSDHAKRYYLNNFAMVVAQNPQALGLTEADSQTLTLLADRYDAAYVTAVQPGSRTTVSVRAKNQARDAAVAHFRGVAMKIKHDPLVTIEQRMSLGIHIDDTTKSRIPAVRTQPILRIQRPLFGGHVLVYCDIESPSRRAKPRGAAHLELHVALTQPGEKPPMTPSDGGRNGFAPTHLVGNFTTTPMTVLLYDALPGAAIGGATATYYGRWVSRTGKKGPWSAAASMQVAYAPPEVGERMVSHQSKSTRMAA